MSRRYTLEECYTVLDVHPKTFRQWLKDDNISTKASKADKRIKFLTEDQIKQLAELHDKPWPPTTSQDTEVIPVTAYKLLIEQVAQATQQIEQVNAAQATLQAGIAELRDQQEAATQQFTALSVAQQEQIQREQQEHEALREHWQKAQTAIQDTSNNNLENTQKFIVENNQQEREALHEQWQKAQTVMQEMQEKLVEGITAQIKQQNESLAQLGARIDELQHIQKEMQTQLQKQQARFQSDLATLHQQMQEKFEQWAQSIEQVQLQGETREAVPEMSVPTRRRTSTRKVAEADPPA